MSHVLELTSDEYGSRSKTIPRDFSSSVSQRIQ